MNESLLRLYAANRSAHPGSQYPHFYTLLGVMNKSAPKVTPVYPAYDAWELSITFAEPNYRAREVVRRSNYRATGKFPSRKNNRMMHWESAYELDAFLILEASPVVRSYSEQPAEIRYLDNSGWKSHFPDVLVELDSGNLAFVEVKPDSVANNHELRLRTQKLKSALGNQGYHYVMVVREQLRSYAYLANAKELMKHCKPSMPAAPWEKVRIELLEKGHLSLSYLIQVLDHDDAKSWISQLLLKGILRCDLAVPLTDNSMIAWAGDGRSA